MTELTFDFGDGRGPVPAHRHINPDKSEGGWVADSATVAVTTTIHVNAMVGYRASIGDGASIWDGAWYMTLGPLGSRRAMLTIVGAPDGAIKCWTGCWSGTLTEFAAAVKKTHEGNQHEEAYAAAIKFITAYAKLKE